MGMIMVFDRLAGGSECKPISVSPFRCQLFSERDRFDHPALPTTFFSTDGPTIRNTSYTNTKKGNSHLGIGQGRQPLRSTFFAKGTQKELEKIAASAYLGDRPKITYMREQYQAKFRNPFQHLENIEGTDKLKEKNIALVGTPNKPYFFCLLWASPLRIDYAPDEVEMFEQLVEHNGHQFSYMTFDKPTQTSAAFSSTSSRGL